MEESKDSFDKSEKSYQKDIYDKLNKKEFTNPPNYSNNLNQNNCKISKENKTLLEKLSKITKFSLISPLEILYKEQYGIFNKTTKEREKCPICLCEFYDDIIGDDTQNIKLKDFESDYYPHEIDTLKLFRCEDHFYHIECLLNYIKGQAGFKCAICQKIYGVIIGNMPNGTMIANISDKIHCDGYPKNETITIKYTFPNGTINGKKYTGTLRLCYIPNTKNGRILLGLLKIAFDRKLTFVVGTSVTTGQKDTVVWNGIHHKTSLNGGAVHYGFPDPTYFNRVCEELAAKGVNKEDFDEKELELLANYLLYNNILKNLPKK